MHALYACESDGGDASTTFEALAEQGKLADRARDFARALFGLVRDNLKWADEHIRQLAVNWELERIALVDRIVLRMAMVELHKCPDVPVKVVLNEAIELAKEYSTMESAAFVNGILDEFVRTTLPPE